MRHGLDFVNLQNPKVRPPPVRLEQRIMIGTETARCAPTMNGGVEHATEIGALDRAAVHADSDEATRKLVHDHEHPVAPEHDGLAAKEVYAPQAVGRVSDERQPRGPSSARGWAIVFRQHAVHDVLVDVYPNVCEMMRAIRGQPNRGLRDLSSTMAWMSAALGPFGPAFFGQGLDENSRLYLRRTSA
jgi:hypothetical protein